MLYVAPFFYQRPATSWIGVLSYYCLLVGIEYIEVDETFCDSCRISKATTMAKQKNHKKHSKKGHNGTELQHSSAPNSPSRNLPRRRRRNMNLLSAEDYKLRQEIERGT